MGDSGNCPGEHNASGGDAQPSGGMPAAMATAIACNNSEQTRLAGRAAPIFARGKIMNMLAGISEDSRAVSAALLYDFWNPLAVSPAIARGVSLQPAGATVVDFWQPTPSAAKNNSTIVDFWWPTLKSFERRDVQSLAPAISAFRLPAFDPLAAEPIYHTHFGLPSTETIITRHARWLVAVLDVPEPRRRAKLLRYFEALFSDFPSRRTFLALRALAESGIDADTFVSGCRFKQSFIETPDYQWRRSRSGTLQVPATDAAKVLSWARAIRLAESCDGDDPETHIEPDWLDEWRELRLGDACYFSYLDFIEDKLKGEANGDWGCRFEHTSVDTDVDRTPFVYRLRSELGRQMFGVGDYRGAHYPPSPTPNIVARRTDGP